MKLLITRPEESSNKLARRLASMGHEVVHSPLITIKFRDIEPVSLEGIQAFVVTSANGVEGLVQNTENRTLPLYAVGDKSAEVANKAGFTKVYSADGDVNSLAALITEKASHKKGILLHAGGARLAGDLEDLLQRSGFQYRREILYDAMDTENLQADALKALKNESLDGVLLFSPHTAKIFAKIVEQNSLSPHLKGVTAWCLSNNVAVEIADLSFRESYIAPSPTEASLLGQLAVKSTHATQRVQMDSDKTRGQGVSKTSNEENKATSKVTSEETTKKSEDQFNPGSAADVKKPLPDALIGTAETSLPRAKKSRVGVVVFALIGVFLLGVAAWPLMLPQVDPYLPEETRKIIQGYLGVSEQTQQIEERLAALEHSQKNAPTPSTLSNLAPVTETLKENRDQVARLKGEVSAQANKFDLEQGRLSQRLQAEEAQSQDLSASIEALKEQILKIQIKKPSGASSTLPVTVEPAPEILASINGLQAALDQLKSDLVYVQQGLSNSENDVSDQKDQLKALSGALHAKLAADAEKTANEDNAVVLLALGQLHRESRAEQPFEGALRQTVAAAPSLMQADLAALRDIAKTGAKARRELMSEFSSLAADITQASRLPTSETWYGKTLHNVASMVKFRRVDDVKGGSVDAVVARAENKVQSNDLTGAIGALKSLKGEPAKVAALWIKDAEKRILVDSSISGLLGKATAMAVQKSGTDK